MEAFSIRGDGLASSFGGMSVVGGGATIIGGLIVSDSVKMSGSLTLSGALSISGSVTLSDSLVVSSNSTNFPIVDDLLTNYSEFSGSFINMQCNAATSARF